MANAALDTGAFTVTELQTQLTAAKAELLRRAGGGSVQSGSSSAQSFAMAKMSEDGLIRLINVLTVALGYPQPETRVAPNFSGRPCFGYAPVVAQSQSRIEPNVGTWADLQALSTQGVPYGTIKIWVETATGITITARLLQSTQATDPSIGAYRPTDYSDPGNTKVWFQASN